MDKEKKEKLKNLLAEIGDENDKKEVIEIDKLDKLADRVDEVAEKLETSTENLTAALEKQRSLVIKSSQASVSAYADSAEMLAQKLDQVAGTITTSYEKNKPVNMAGVYKDMINQLSAIDTSVKNKPVPVWNWPQYAAVSVRNKNFANIDPAVAYLNGTATEDLPYGTLPAFDNAGTITIVSAANPLPVTASVSINSTAMAGLQVDITRVTTSAFAGIRVFQQNSPQVTVTSSTMSGLVVNVTKFTSTAITGAKYDLVKLKGVAIDSNAGNVSNATQRVVIATDQPAFDVNASVSVTSTPMAGLVVNVTKVTTSALAGARVYVNNPGGAQAVNIQDGGNSITVDGTVTATITSTSLAGLTTNIKQLGGVAISMNEGLSDAGTQRVTIATDDTVTVDATNLDIRDLTFAADKVDASGSTLAANSGVDIGDVTINNASGGSAVNIQDGGNTITVDGTVTATIVSTTIAGLHTDFRKIVGTVVDVNSGNKSAGTQRVVLATDQPNVPTNIAAATTSVLSGVKVQLKNDSVATVTTAVAGIVASASGDTKLVPAQGAGKRIYVYAWNMSFAGTVNAKLTDGTSSKILAGLIYGVANSGGGNSVSPNFLLKTPQPALFYTSENSSLYINLSGSVAVGGSISWFTV